MGRAKRLGLVLKVVLCLCFTGTLGCVASIWHCWKCRWWSVMASFHQYSRLLMPLEKGSPISFTAVSTLRYLPGAVIAALLGLLVDFPMVTFIALCKSPYMLFKGWHRLFHDLIGGEGPLLETMFVPFAGLAIIFRPLAVDGVLLGSMASSIFLGAYAGLIVYQESSFWFGLCYVVASLAIYDEYCNDVPDMPEASCFPS